MVTMLINTALSYESALCQRGSRARHRVRECVIPWYAQYTTVDRSCVSSLLVSYNKQSMDPLKNERNQKIEE
jgi:hypothetical protein